MFGNLTRYTSWLIALATGTALLGLIAFTDVQQGNKRCRGIVVRIDGAAEGHFLTKRDVTGYITNEGTDPLLGAFFSEMNFVQLEARLRQHGLVQDCEVARDLDGNLLVRVEEPTPVARLIKNSTELQAISGLYVSENGRFFPISMNYSARVPLLTGSYFNKRVSLTDTNSRPLLALLKTLRQNAFWRAMITDVNADSLNNITLASAADNLQIELGEPTDIELKFTKLKLFYKYVLPLKRLGHYRRVSVQYRNQLVCE
jgi:cell division protein FtsQ